MRKWGNARVERESCSQALSEKARAQRVQGAHAHPTHGHSELHHASSRRLRNIRGISILAVFRTPIRNYLQIARIKMARFQIMCDIFQNLSKSRDFAFVRVCRTGSLAKNGVGGRQQRACQWG